MERGVRDRDRNGLGLGRAMKEKVLGEIWGEFCSRPRHACRENGISAAGSFRRRHVCG